MRHVVRDAAVRAIAYESMVVWGMVGMVASEISGKVQ